MRMSRAAAALLALLLSASAVAAASPRRHVLIVANNHSLDPGQAPLRFADDDGARWFELFTAAGAQVTLLAVLDPDAQARYPEAARASRPPRRAALNAALGEIFGRILEERSQGLESQLYFVYSGHGGLGPNREGYLHLLDERLGRTALYRDLVARSPATYNHLILDACNAYFVVHKRGGQDDHQGDFSAAVRDFLRAEELSSYPNTGVILGASSESETHEWSRYQAGVFSHELRSALAGAADVDNDGAVSYAEAAASLEAANAAIDNPQARLRVYDRPPAARVDLPLLRLDAFDAGPWLRIDPAQAGRYHLEDSRGVRLVDLHSSAEQPVRLALVGAAPFFLRSAEAEARIAGSGEVRAADLRFGPWDAASRGAVEESFRKHLFEVPFGLSFYRGVNATRPKLEPARSSLAPAPAPAPTAPPAPGPGLLLIAGGASLGIGALAAGLGLGAGVLSRLSYADYQAAEEGDAARQLHRVTEQQALAANVLFGAAGLLTATGAALVAADLLGGDE